MKRFYNKDFIESMELLLGECSGVLVTSAPAEKQVKPFKLPLANDNMRRVYAYLLNRRGIDLEVINTFVYKRMIYESKEYHNVVFVGFDKNGKACHAHKRGTTTKSTFKGNIDSSLPQYSFHWHGTSTKLFIFEAPIDMLSFISMHKEKAKWFAGAALNTTEQSMASVMSTALSRLNSFLDSELEQLLCFDTEIDAEKFCNEKSAIFVIMPEENPNTFFMISLVIQQLYRVILVVADGSGGN